MAQYQYGNQGQPPVSIRNVVSVGLIGGGILAVLLMIITASCAGVAKPDAGQEAVLVKKPWFFGHGGVDPTPVTTGRSYVAWSTQVVYVTMTPLQFTEHFDDLMSREGVPLDFDSALRMQITNSVEMVRRFGVYDVGDGSRSYPAWYANNVVAPYRNFVRQAVRKHGMNETAINTVAIEQIDKEVSENLTKYIDSIQLPAKLVDVTVGRANPPDAIKNQRVETATQEQRVNTEAMRLTAEQKREAAERQRAVSDNAYRQGMSLDPAQFVALEQIKMLREVCTEHANAKGEINHSTCSFVIGANASALVGVK